MVNLSFNFGARIMVAAMSGGQSPAEHGRVYEAIENLDRIGREQNRPIALIFVVAPDNPAPNAHWRRRFAEQRRTFRSPHVFLSIVTRSAVIRGVLTALNWISPEPPHVTSTTHAMFDESAAWIQRNQGTSRVVLRKLLEAEASSRPTGQKRSG